MLLNYLTIAARTLRKRVGPTVINVIGLTVGVAACLLIGLWVERELSFDDFHPEADRVYRMAVEARITDAMNRTPAVPAPLAPALQHDVPQVESVTRFRPNRVIFRQQSTALSERLTLMADSAFFDVLGGFELMHGARETALDDTDALVLSETTARALFGRTDVVGEVVQMDDATRRVTGVLADVPETSHLQFDAVAASPGVLPVFQANWTGFGYLIYAKLVDGASMAALQDGLDGIVENHAMADVQNRFGDPSDNFVYRLFPEALPSIHLYSDLSVLGPSGSIATVYTFALIGLFILLIACINFMNLATARATERATEVGMRKALGAGRGQLTGQFLGEALLVTAVATSAVPKVTVIVGGSYGAGNYGMCGRAYAPRFLWTWPAARIAVMGGDQAAGVLASVRREAAEARGQTWDAAQEEAVKAPVRAQFAEQSHALYASARLWDDGIIDPRRTREVLALSLAAALNAPIPETRFGVFRM